MTIAANKPALLHKALIAQGFNMVKSGVVVSGHDVSGILAATLNRWGGGQGNLTLGFIIHELVENDAFPTETHKCHVYGSNTTIFPEFDEFTCLLSSGDLQDNWKRIAARADEIASAIRSALNADTLARMYFEGRFGRCMILKGARSLMESIKRPAP